MSKHLPINGDCHPKQWIALCGATGRHTSFVTDFNDASCEECRMLELSYVHEYKEQVEYNQFTADDVPLFV